MLLVPVSAGELLDKISILRIKQDRIQDEKKRENVSRELAELQAIETEHLKPLGDYASLYEQLYAVNAKLWDIEDGKRDCERKKRFDEHFVQLARSVYIENDRRAAIKRQLNEQLGSAIVEEKSYAAY